MIDERKIADALERMGSRGWEEIEFDVTAAIAENDIQKVWNLVATDIYRLEKYQIVKIKNKVKDHFGRDFSARDFNDAIRECQQKARAAVVGSSPTDQWRNKLMRNESGSLKTVFANVVTVLENAQEFQGVLRYDEFNAEVWAGSKAPPWEGAVANQPWTDHEDRKTWYWIQTHHNLHLAKEPVGEAIQMVAQQNPFHPVREYLLGLEWDGTPRIDTWVTDYLGASPHKSTDFLREASSKWLISAVARIMHPGVKVDCCLVLQGKQGIKKSTAIRALAGDDWFTDDMEVIGSKDAAMQCRGVWIIELAELGAIKKAEVENIKSFMSRAADRFRPPYGKRVIKYPRQCVFAGSVNTASFLKDETGARRFWPVTTGAVKPIDVEGLAKARDQLWAEALFRYNEGEKWYIDPGTPAGSQATEEQEARYIEQPYDGAMEDFEEKQRELASLDAEELVVQSKAFFDHIKVETAHLGPAQTTMAAAAFRRAKWVEARRWVTNEVTGEKQRKRVWVKAIW
jgi:predicted P-loop ATPase